MAGRPRSQDGPDAPSPCVGAILASSRRAWDTRTAEGSDVVGIYPAIPLCREPYYGTRRRRDFITDKFTGHWGRREVTPFDSDSSFVLGWCIEARIE